MNLRKKIRLGTRGSALALWQAHAVASALGADCEIAVIETSGDRFLNVSLQGQVEKGFFTREIEAQLLSGLVDVAVHSLKDLPTGNPPGLVIGALLERAPVSDLLLVRPDWLDPDRPLPLRPGCRVGATSLRRQALLAAHAPGCEAAFLRGNVPSRVRKCLEGQYGAIILARAGIGRLQPDMGALRVYELDPEHWLPAPGQGAIAVQVREEDAATRARLQALDHEPTRRAVEIERGLLARFEGGCHTAFGAWARPAGEGWEVRLGLDRPPSGWGQTCWRDRLEGCLAAGPADLIDRLEAPRAPLEGLCRPIQW